MKQNLLLFILGITIAFTLVKSENTVDKASELLNDLLEGSK